MESPSASWPGIARAPAKAPEDRRERPYVPATHASLCGTKDVGARHNPRDEVPGAGMTAERLCVNATGFR
jgi:hypothetical protein